MVYCINYCSLVVAIVNLKMMQKVARSIAAPLGVKRMSTISGVKAREIIDSRGNPTLEVNISYIICA